MPWAGETCSQAEGDHTDRGDDTSKELGGEGGEPRARARGRGCGLGKLVC